MIWHGCMDAIEFVILDIVICNFYLIGLQCHGAKLHNAEPAINPPANTYMELSIDFPYFLTNIALMARANSAVHPAAGFQISRPVAKRIPICFDVPPIN